MTKRTLGFTLFLLICLNLPLDVTAEIITIPESVPPPLAVREAFDLDPFYQQWIDVEGLPVVASATVNPYALKEAAWLIRQMIGHRPEVLRAMADNKIRFVVMAYNEMTTDIPEHSDLRPDFFWDRRARGLGATWQSRAVSCGEENLLNYPGDPYSTENILIHEFAHTIHEMGLVTTDPSFDNRLKSTYETAIRNGLWAGTYGSSNKQEYWAVGVQAWFHMDRQNDAEINHVNTRTELKDYDPALASLISEVFGDTDWRYTRARTRLNLPHMQGFDPQGSPTFEWPAGLLEQHQALTDPDSDGNGQWVNLKRYDPSELSGLKSRDGAATEIMFVNNIGADILLYWVDSHGNERFYGRVAAGGVSQIGSFAGHIWLVKDQNGENLAVFQAVARTGRAYIDMQVLQSVNFSVGELRTVRVIYFLPNDRQPQSDIDTEIGRLIKDVQQSYAEVMENHGFGRKTFRLETDVDGKVVVHHVNGRFSDAYYHTDTSNKVVWQETAERFDLKHNIYLIVLDVSNAVIDGYCGQGAATGPEGGGVLIPAPNSRLQRERGWSCFNVAVAAHELGHGFGLSHDRLKNANRKPSSYHADEMTSSFCAAEWLDVHRYFNFGTTYPEQNQKTTIQMSLPVASSPNTIRLRFEITDADGLHQAQLSWIGDVIACQELDGQRDVYEFDLMPSLHGTSNSVVLRVIDRHGNFTEKNYPINIASLLPPPQVVSIPDTKLAATIREELNLATGDSFTQWNLTELRSLDASNHGISDLTGLEHTTQLQALTLSGNGITDISSLASLEILESLNLSQNKITDIGVLANMTNLTTLNLQNNSISDISAIAGLPNLLWLNLDNNSVSDISAVAGLTNLTSLFLGSNSVSDISPLTGLTNLTWLDLDNNSISDISAVAGLTDLTTLYLGRNSISDISEVSGLVNLTGLFLWNNSISDISPLIANKGLERGDMVNVVGNPLSYLSIHTHIPTLQSRGVTVEFDNQVDRGPDKITGPWLWMIAPTAPGQGGAQSNNIDSLAAASNGHVAEAGVAANGAREGDTVGNYVWTLGTITATGRDNINDVINAIGMARGNVDHHSSYALITLESITAQRNVTMWVGSDDSIKVWLNGEVVHNNPIDRGATDFQDRFTVNLKQGENLLLVKVSEGRVDWSMFVGIEADVNAVYKRPPDPVVSADVNRDGVVNILDLIVIASSLGQSGQSDADVNGDRVVSILDLVLAAGMFEEAATAPSAQPQVPETLTAVEVQNWLTNAMSLEVKDPIAKKGIIVLEQLLIFLTPTETELLANYPNPFNPETWIPYRLAEEAFVTLTIYDLNGQIVRTIDVGHQTAAVYESRSKAIYWDGRNGLGEQVASGVYFYHLSAGRSGLSVFHRSDYSATRKMVILK